MSNFIADDSGLYIVMERFGNLENMSRFAPMESFAFYTGIHLGWALLSTYRLCAVRAVSYCGLDQPEGQKRRTAVPALGLWRSAESGDQNLYDEVVEVA